jgi:PKD repeat protein
MWNNNTNNYIAQFSYGSEPALQASVSIPMTETNLDDAIVTLNLLDDTFIDNDINPVNLVLNNAPTGLSIESINYIGSTQILALLAFDGTDFDTNITDFNVSINGSELTSGNNLTSNNLLITAINEDAGIWSHLITAENMEFTLGDNINPWINMEIGQTTWDGANIGYGLSNTDETTFTWINAEWYEDGEGNNKKVHAQINIQDNMSTGIYYYGGRAKATATSAWYYANNEIWAETTEFAPEYTITINPVPDPVSIEANALDGTRIQLNWTADSEYNNVIILAKEGSEISATPEQGTLYAINDVIDDATVIYKGSNSSFIHNNLNHLTSYYYKVFTINNNYYSNAIVANTTTTDEDGCTFDIFLGNDTAICGGTAILINPGLEVSPYGDSLTITYNATITGELIDAEKVYMHSGAEMAPDNGWEYVVGNWGDDDGIGLMTEIADNIWQITIVPVNYYQYPSAQSLYGIYMKFRNANGSIDAGDNAGDEIWLNMSIAPPIADFNAIEVNYIPSTISSITWSNNSHEPTLSIANSGEYWISATDMNGCVGQDTINIGIQPLPQVNIGNDTAFCTGGELLLYPGIFDAYHWQDNTTDTSIVVTIPGVYAVTITDEYGCQGFDVIVVQVVDPPTAMFSYTDLGNNTIEFVDESTNANTYAWDFDNDGDIDSDIAGNVQYTYPSIGQYGVSLTVENVCSDDIYSTTIMILSIEDILLGEINIYPNPVSEILQIETELFQSETIYKIIDLSGKTIYTTSASGNLTEIDVSKLANGYYILNIISSATSQSIRFVKQ